METAAGRTGEGPVGGRRFNMHEAPYSAYTHETRHRSRRALPLLPNTNTRYNEQQQEPLSTVLSVIFRHEPHA